MAAFVISHPNIIGGRRTLLTTSTAAAATSFPVENGSVFSQNNFGLFNGYGAQTSELLRFSAVATTTLTSSSGASFSHASGTSIEVIPYNQVVIEYSTNFSTLWETGLYATLADTADAATWVVGTTLDLAVSQSDGTYYDDSSTQSRTYRTRFYNSFSAVYSNYSSPVLPTGFEEKSIGAIIRKATNITNKKITSTDVGQVNYEFLFDEINQCLRDISGSRKRWSHDANYNGTIGDIVAGTHRYILPSNIEARDTAQSIWNVKINDQWNLEYIDKREYDRRTVGQHWSQLSVALTSASTTATFDDTSNFSDDGTFIVWVDGVEMTITYTANNRTTNVLTLSSASTEVTATAAIDSYVWQNASFGIPRCFTIWNGYIYFDVVPSDTIHDRTINSDYYLKIQQITGVGDYIRESDPNLIINWLRWSIMIKANNPQLAAMYRQMYMQGLDDLKKLEWTGQKKYLVPNSWNYNRRNYNDDRFFNYPYSRN